MFIKINNERYNINTIENYHTLDDSRNHSIEFIVNGKSIIVDYPTIEERDSVLLKFSEREINLN